MTFSFRRLALLSAAASVACSLAGCASINAKIADGMGDYIPQWAGGLPADAPPRPGTTKYDEYMRSASGGACSLRPNGTTTPRPRRPPRRRRNSVSGGCRSNRP
jgi:hypothetical protein